MVTQGMGMLCCRLCCHCAKDGSVEATDAAPVLSRRGIEALRRREPAP